MLLKSNPYDWFLDVSLNFLSLFHYSTYNVLGFLQIEKKNFFFFPTTIEVVFLSDFVATTVNIILSVYQKSALATFCYQRLSANQPF